jgi:hypothetical protein
MRSSNAARHAGSSWPIATTSLVTLLALVLAVLGCGGKQQAAGPSSPGLALESEAAAKVDRTKCDDRGKQVSAVDANQDGRADVWKLYQVVDQGGQKLQVLTCKQVDLNHDAKLDVVYHYEAGNLVSFEEFDLDFDGRFDLWTFYQAGKKVREEMDTNYDRRPDFSKYYENEKLVRIERDRNHDGRVDEWMYYEGGRLDRIGYDTQGTGRVDKWDRSPEGDAPGGGAAGAAASSGGENAPGSPVTPAPAAPAGGAPATAPVSAADTPAAAPAPPPTKK